MSTSFAEAIQQFDGDFPVAHLKLIMDDLGNTRAETRALDGAGNSPDYVITIALNNHTNTHGVGYRPNLMNAKTIAHEVIHANLYLALYEYRNGNTSNLPDINDFPQIYEQYRLIKNWQHEFMADHYINLMSQTLEEIHPYLNDQQFLSSLGNYNMSLNDFYKSISYMGLEGTTGMDTYLNSNAENYQISFQHALVNSTSEPNCD